MSKQADPDSITPADSPLRYRDIMASPAHVDLLTPKVQPGDMAPDLTLQRVDEPGAAVSLAEVARNQPVALIFGSYT